MATFSGVLCDAQHITKYAELWCPECEEGLCSDCQKHHGLSKATRSHGTIPVDQYKKLPSSISEIVHHCKDHGIKYTNYCSHHDKLCCPDCISTTHGECKGFLSVREIIKTAKTSTLLDNMEHSLTDIESNIEKVLQNREHNLSNIKQQRHKFQDDLKKMRDKINSHLDTMENNLTSELDAAEKKLQTKIENFINRLSKERKSVHALKINIQSLKEHASDLQTFLGSTTYQPEVQKAERYLKSLSEDGSLDELSLKCSIDNKILETLRTLTFGSVTVETGPSSLVLKTERDKQTQIMAVIPQPSPTSIKDIKLSLHYTYNIPKPTGDYGYSGCIIHPSGKYILADRSGAKLIVLNDDGIIDKDIPCTWYVNDVTTIDNGTVAVSTANGIHILNIDSKQIEKVFKTSRWCFGISYHKGALLWCEQSKGLQRMNLSYRNITTLVKQDQLPHDSYVTTYRDKIYQTNRKTKTVTCYIIKGERLWEYKNESVLKDPVGITVDSNGNIYVTTPWKVVVITADGTNGKQILSQSDGMHSPWGIFYEKTNNNVLIVNRFGPAFLYHVS